MKSSRRGFMAMIAALFVWPFEKAHARNWRWVSARRTPMTWDQARKHIAATNIPEQAVTLLTAQWALETLRGKKMYRYNYAGIKGTGPEGIFCYLRTSERKRGKKIVIRTRFRAYTTPQLGAEDFVNVIKDKFPNSFKAACDGNVRLYARTLKQEKYYTSSSWMYEKGLKRHIEKSKKMQFKRDK